MANARAGTAFIDVRGDFRPFDRQLRGLNTTAKSRFARVGKVAAAGFGLGAGAVIGKAITKSFGEFQEAEKAGRGLRSTLKQTGNVAGITAKEIEALSTSISLKTGIDDEAIQSSQGLLLTFRQIRDEAGKGNQVFTRASKSVVDLSARFDQSLKSSAIQLGKALNDPVKGVTALQRVGVQFSEKQREQIDVLVKHNKTLQAQKIILGEVETQTKGFAASQATGTAKFRVAVENLEESFGKLFGPSVERASTKIATFVNQMQAGRGAGGRFAKTVKEIAGPVGQVAKGFGNAAKNIAEFAAEHPNVTKIATSAALIGTVLAKFKIPKGLGALLALTRGGGLGGAGGGVAGFVQKAPVKVLVVNPGFGPGGGKGPGGGVFGKVRRGFSTAAETAGAVGSAGAAAGGGPTAAGLGALGVGALGVGIIAAVALKVNKNLETRGPAAQRRAETGTTGSVGGLKSGTIGVSGSAIQKQRDAVNRARKDTKDWATDTEKSGNRIKDSLRGLQSGYNKTRERTDQLTARTSSLAGSVDRGSKRTKGLTGSLKDAGAKALGAARQVSGLGRNVDALPSRKTINIDILTKISDQLRNLPSLLQGLDPLADNIDRLGRRGRRSGGLVGMRGGGLVPAMLSPGEVGITPSGGSFKVPGQRTAADSVGMLLPNRTAILTADGQRKARSGMGLADILRTQRPHFRKGGIAEKGKSGINIAAIAAKAAGFTGRTLVNMLAIAGRESSWNPKAVNIGPRDHSIGLWQINQLAHKGKFGSDSALMNPLTNAKAAKSLYSASGYSPWVSVQYGNATQFLDEAKRAVAATSGAKGLGGLGGKGGTKITPAAITHPLLATQLRPLVDDALLGGIDAARERTGRAGRVDLLQSVLEGIVPDSADRATREQIAATTTGGGKGGKGDPRIVRFMKARASGIDSKHFPYSSPGNRAFGLGGPMDCSGAVSKVIGPNLLDSVKTSGFFKTWGQAGKGQHITTYAKGDFSGAGGHVFMEIDGKGFGTSGANPGGGAGWFDVDPSYRSQFVARHPKGLRRGGMVSDKKAAEIFQRLPKRMQRPGVLAEIKRGGILPGLRRGGIAAFRTGGQPGGPPVSIEDIAEALEEAGRSIRRHSHRRSGRDSAFNPRRLAQRPGFDLGRFARGRRNLGIGPLVQFLGADQLGSQNADTATRLLGRRAQGSSFSQLRRAELAAKRQIRKLAKHGFTGPERIRARRLQGGISLLQDQQGRQIGAPLGRSDRLQSLIERRSSTLNDRLTVLGVDPESTQGLQVAKGEQQNALFRLARRRAELQKSLKRARRTKNPQAVRAVQDEIQEVDDQMLSLRASIINLDKTIKETGEGNTLEEIKALMEQANQLQADRNAQLAQNRALVQGQGPALIAALSMFVNGDIGAQAQIAKGFPSRPGTGGVARI